MNFLKKFLGSSPKGELAMIPTGELFLKRSPGSPKSSKECLYTDAVASIRESSSPHNYLLVVTRAMEEGDEELVDDDDAAEAEDESKDERIFLIDEELKIKLIDDEVIGLTVSWLNIDGDEDESFEFVVDDSVKKSEVEQFIRAIHGCCFERKFGKSSVGVTDEQLKMFEFVENDEASHDHADLMKGFDSLKLDSSSRREVEEADDDSDEFEDAQDNTPHLVNITTPTGSVITKGEAQLHIFDPLEGCFKLFASSVDITVLDLGHWEYFLGLKNDSIEIGSQITDELNSRFESSVNSFIFNYFTQEAFTFLLRFPDFEALDEFKQGFMKAYHEHSNQSKWEKQDQGERDYVMGAFDEPVKDEQMLDYEDISESESGSDDDQEEEGDDNEEEGFVNKSSGLHKQNFSDSDDDDDEHKPSFKSQNKNLTISFKNDRSYVTNGNKIGVFQTTRDDELKYSTTIEGLKVKGEDFTPGKMMLHTADRSLIMQGSDDSSKLYRMDLTKGQIVDEWQVRDDLSVVEFGPNSKFNQMTEEQTFLGISDRGIFKVDPRLSGDKIVESEHKSYVTKNGFSSFSTTENGYIAIASTKGDIRLYDKLGLRAKSLLPAIGDKIKHVEISSNGHWLLATCSTYLMLIDLSIKDGAKAGKLGFEASFGKDKLPKTRMLKISPEHFAYMKATSKKPLDFSKAYFNSGVDAKEQTIVSSSGPYAITWSLKKILRGDAEPYLIKRYSSNVVADNFKFGTDQNVIIALEDDVGMVNKRAFRKADRNSLAFKAGNSFV